MLDLRLTVLSTCSQRSYCSAASDPRARSCLLMECCQPAPGMPNVYMLHGKGRTLVWETCRGILFQLGLLSFDQVSCTSSRRQSTCWELPHCHTSMQQRMTLEYSRDSSGATTPWYWKLVWVMREDYSVAAILLLVILALTDWRISGKLLWPHLRLGSRCRRWFTAVAGPIHQVMLILCTCSRLLLPLHSSFTCRWMSPFWKFSGSREKSNT